MSRPERVRKEPAPSLTEERIQKVLSRAGVSSRREAERWLAEGRITVNGTVVTTPGTRVDPERDHIKIDGKRIKEAGRRVYYLLNKPPGFVTSVRDPQGRPVVMDLLRGVSHRVFPVGRLDYHTSGLLLLTNDGDLADKLMRPASGCPKVYHAKVRGLPTPVVIERLSRGVVIEGRRTLPCRIRPLRGARNAWFEVTLTEGRRNQIRKMFKAVGHPVAKLRRVAIGPLADRVLPLGRHRELSPREVRSLMEALR
ncbi:MAG TPA: pseudouridine synthase [Candidatus Polarisedimenticolia bacterium]|nr:pseudouridine synthase [Candidatus Polarisedimenticolia bacterium]